MENQETILIDVKTESISKKEIKLPYYTTDGICHWYKVINQQKALQVMWSKYEGSLICVQIVDSSLALSNNNKGTTADDFNTHYEKTLTQLNELV
jgi:hypothetical protein